MKRFLQDYLEYAQPKVTEYTKDPEKTKTLLNDVAEKTIGNEKSLGKTLQTISTMGEMVKLSMQRSYKKLPLKTLSSILLAFVYFLLPIDLIPDFIAFTGLTDDVAVFALVARNISKDIKNFEKWKEEQQKTE